VREGRRTRGSSSSSSSRKVVSIGKGTAGLRLGREGGREGVSAEGGAEGRGGPAVPGGAGCHFYYLRLGRREEEREGGEEEGCVRMTLYF
jgi:hypothetical protein